jgi:hypothetical protein
MTVIAWDGKTLAADKRAVEGGGIARTVSKISRFGECLIGMTGHWDTAVEMRTWFMEGADPAKFPDKAREDKATLIVIREGSIMTYCSGPHPMPIETERIAFGSGRDYAEAAMYLGESAINAVSVTCHFQSDCGNGIDFLDLKGDRDDNG